jgi:hypothetical protein
VGNAKDRVRGIDGVHYAPRFTLVLYNQQSIINYLDCFLVHVNTIQFCEKTGLKPLLVHIVYRKKTCLKIVQSP